MAGKGRPFRKMVLTGALLVMPMLVTLFLLNFVLDKVDKYFTPWFLGVVKVLDQNGDGVPDDRIYQYLVPILGVCVVLVAVYLIGLMGSHYIGRRIIRSMEEAILRVPLVKGIYGSARQLFGAFKIGSSDTFSRVVLVEYPRLGMHSLAFVTKQLHPDLQLVGEDRNLVFVFIPTTPNPTSGFLLAVPETDLIDTGLSVEDGLKTIVSGGMVDLPPGRAGDGAETSKASQQ